jgi:predicted phosphohydrolase
MQAELLRMKDARFVVISDTHFYAPGNGKDGQWWHRTLHSRPEQVAEALIQSVVPLKPDFVIHCGDLTGLCEMDNFHFAKRAMDRLGCPWYVVPGNHDTWYPGVRAAFSKLYDLEDERCYYNRLINNIHFLFLDTCYWAAADGTVSPYLDKDKCDSGQIAGLYVSKDQLVWLVEQLEEYPDHKAILISHAPVRYKPFYPATKFWDGTPTQDGRLDLAEVIDGVVNIDEVRHVIDQHSNIIAMFNGHWHINDINIRNGVVYCQTASLREWPFEFRLVEVSNRTVSISTHGLNDSDLREDSYLDALGNDWIAGEPEGRSYTFKI